MIQVTIPEIDFSCYKDQIKSIAKDLGGVYLIYGIEGDLLYVGQATNLRRRIYQHTIGQGNTAGFSRHFHRFEMFYVEDIHERWIYEYYLINVVKPRPKIQSGEISRSAEWKKSDSSSLHPDWKCQATNVKGNRCGSRANANGFCRFHGGNGVTKMDIYSEAMMKVNLGG